MAAASVWWRHVELPRHRFASGCAFAIPDRIRQAAQSLVHGVLEPCSAVAARDDVRLATDNGHEQGPSVFERAKYWARAVKRDVVALYLAARDPRTPWYAKAVVLAVVAYALSPVDPIPDFIPVLDYLDDLLIVPLGILLAIRLVPVDLMAEFPHTAAARPLPCPRWIGMTNHKGNGGTIYRPATQIDATPPHAWSCAQLRARPAPAASRCRARGSARLLPDAASRCPRQERRRPGEPCRG